VGVGLLVVVGVGVGLGVFVAVGVGVVVEQVGEPEIVIFPPEHDIVSLPDLPLVEGRVATEPSAILIVPLKEQAEPAPQLSVVTLQGVPALELCPQIGVTPSG
jgi:hypothetical protein